MKKIYLSNFGSENSIIYNKIEENILNKKDFIYILPNKDLIIERRKSFLENKKGFINFKIYTFDDILKNLTENKLPYIIDEQTKILMLEIITDNMIKNKELDYFNTNYKFKGLFNSISDFIRKVKGNLIGPAELLSSSNLKIKELAKIYDNYEKFLFDKSIYDRESIYFLAQQELEKSSLNQQDIFIDNFIDLRKIEIKLIEYFINKGCNIYINLPFIEEDEENLSLYLTLSNLKELGFEVEYIKNNENSNNPLPKYNNIISGKPLYEISKIIKIIKDKNINESIDLKDMQIILADESYEKDLISQALKEKIPLDISSKRSISEYPLIIELTNLLDFIVSGGKKEYLLNRVNSYYFNDICLEKKDTLEKELRKLSFNNLQDLSTSLLKTNFETSDEMLDEIIEIKNLYLKELHLEKKEKPSYYSQIILDYIEKYNIDNIILENYIKIKDEEILNRDMFLINKIRDILEKISSLDSLFEKITNLQFYDLILNYLGKESYSLKSNKLGVKVYSPIEAVGLNSKIKFFTGLNVDYPRTKESNFLLCRNYSKELKKYNIVVDDPNYIRDNEYLVFKDIISRSEVEVFLSSSRTDIEEKGECSVFLTKSTNLITNDNILALSLFDTDYNNITTYDELAVKLLRDNYSNKDINTGYLSLYNHRCNDIETINSRITCEIEREKDFNIYSGKLSKEVFQIDYKKSFTPSSLEDYLICPYFYFLKRVIEVEEMEREFNQKEYLELGIIFHEVLENYFNSVASSDRLNEIDENLLSKIIKNSIVNSYDENLDNGLFYQYIYSTLLQYIAKDLEVLKSWDKGYMPTYFEEKVSTRINGVKILGRIDRIDTLGDKEILIDYKLNNSVSKSNIENGVSLQMPLYILARQEIGKDVVAGEYGVITKANVVSPLRNIDRIEKFDNSTMGIKESDYLSLLENSKLIVNEILKNIIEGNFSVNPKSCKGSNCPYRNVCRYVKENAGEDDGN